MEKDLSRFMRKTLLPGEKCVRDARFHIFYTVCAFLTLLLCAALGYAVYYAAARYAGIYTLIPIYAGAAVGAWLCFWMMLKKWTTEIILTDKRLIYKRGFFLVKVAEMDIDQLASDDVQQSIWGRLLDYGAIHIRCIEAADVWLPDIARPYDFRNALEQEKHKYREHYMNVDRLRRHGGNHE